MEIDLIHALNFSPAGHTATAVEAVAKGFGQTYRMLDISNRETDFAQWSFDVNDVCIVGVPSFGGRVPPVAVKRLSAMRAEHTLAVPVVTYGNRAYDDTLLELQDTLQERGFTVVAAVTAVAEHTICPAIAHGRPNAADLAELTGFGKQIKAYLNSTDIFHNIKLPGNFPYCNYDGVPFKPETGSKCIKCRRCAMLCPVGAIPPESPNQTNGKLCITCMRCINICPAKARSLSWLVRFTAQQKLSKLCTDTGKNELFIKELDYAEA